MGEHGLPGTLTSSLSFSRHTKRMSLPLFPPTNPPAIALCLPFNPISHQRSDTISPLLYFTFRTERRTEGKKDEDRQRRRYRPREKRLLPHYYSSQTEGIESVLLFLFTIEGFDALTPRVT